MILPTCKNHGQNPVWMENVSVSSQIVSAQVFFKKIHTPFFVRLKARFCISSSLIHVYPKYQHYLNEWTEWKIQWWIQTDRRRRIFFTQEDKVRPSPLLPQTPSSSPLLCHREWERDTWWCPRKVPILAYLRKHHHACAKSHNTADMTVGTDWPILWLKVNYVIFLVVYFQKSCCPFTNMMFFNKFFPPLPSSRPMHYE